MLDCREPLLETVSETEHSTLQQKWHAVSVRQPRGCLTTLDDRDKERSRSHSRHILIPKTPRPDRGGERSVLWNLPRPMKSYVGLRLRWSWSSRVRSSRTIDQ